MVMFFKFLAKLNKSWISLENPCCEPLGFRVEGFLLGHSLSLEPHLHYTDFYRSMEKVYL